MQRSLFKLTCRKEKVAHDPKGFAEASVNLNLNANVAAPLFA